MSRPIYPPSAFPTRWNLSTLRYFIRLSRSSAAVLERVLVSLVDDGVRDHFAGQAHALSSLASEFRRRSERGCGRPRSGKWNGTLQVAEISSIAESGRSDRGNADHPGPEVPERHRSRTQENLVFRSGSDWTPTRPAGLEPTPPVSSGRFALPLANVREKCVIHDERRTSAGDRYDQAEHVEAGRFRRAEGGEDPAAYDGASDAEPDVAGETLHPSG